MPRCLRCKAGAEWIEGDVAPEESEKLAAIKQWCDAYPLAVFPEPDLQRARAALEDRGLTLDSISASAMRHVLNGIRAIIEA